MVQGEVALRRICRAPPVRRLIAAPAAAASWLAVRASAKPPTAASLAAKAKLRARTTVFETLLDRALRRGGFSG